MHAGDNRIIASYHPAESSLRRTEAIAITWTFGLLISMLWMTSISWIAGRLIGVW